MSRSPAGPVAGPTDARQLVADGYDHIAERYRDWTKPHDPTRSWFVDEVIARVPSGSDVVELGVGSGGTVTEELVAAHRYTGVDISPSQVALARASHAEGDFRVADLVTLRLPEASCDAVVAAYVMGHVPIDDREDLYRRISRWIRPDRLVLRLFSHGRSARRRHRVELARHAHVLRIHAVGTRIEALEEASFRVDRAVVITDDEDGRPAPFRWVFAQRRSSQ